MEELCTAAASVGLVLEPLEIGDTDIDKKKEEATTTEEISDGGAVVVEDEGEGKMGGAATVTAVTAPFHNSVEESDGATAGTAVGEGRPYSSSLGLEHVRFMETPYLENPRSMLRSRYSSALFVARKITM